MLRTAALAVALLFGAQAQAYEVEKIGSLFIGGKTVTVAGDPTTQARFTASGPLMTMDPNGEFITGQMYASYVRLAHPKARYPLMLWHGGGLSGSVWEDKPDGKPGWANYFLTAGHSVYISDAQERGRAGFPRADMVEGTPIFRPMKQAWELFRIGPAGSWNIDPAKRVRYPDSRFPAASAEGMARMAIPRWTTTDAPTQAAYDAYVQAVGPSVILAHSQGAPFAQQAAATAPDRVKAVIIVEGSGAPDPTKVDPAKVKGVPHLYVWGDHLDGAPWPAFKGAVDKWAQAIRDAGGTADVIELPKRGLAGNSHMMMLDENSDEIAGLIQGWIASKGLMTP
jgi:pimeloyl-ACP methyl ester carboxylesterase